MFQIQGSGNVIARERSVSSFIKLHLTTGGTAEIIQSNEEKVIVECDDNLQEYVQATNSGRTLYIVEESGLRKARFTKLHIKIFVRHIDAIINNMEGNAFTSTPIVSDQPFDLRINAEGDSDFELRVASIKCVLRCEGDVTLRGECGDANIRTMMEGHLFAKDFLAGTLYLRNMSEGNMEVYSREKISITHMGEGYVHYYGPGTLKDIKFMGEGEVKHID